MYQGLFLVAIAYLFLLCTIWYKASQIEHGDLVAFGEKSDQIYTGDGTKLDFAGRSVEYLITFEEFLDTYMGKDKDYCHHFIEWGFLYDEEGIYGFANTLVGFKTKEDKDKYWTFIQQNSME